MTMPYVVWKGNGGLKIVQADNIRDETQSYGKFAIFTRLKVDLETPTPLSSVLIFPKFSLFTNPSPISSLVKIATDLFKSTLIY